MRVAEENRGQLKAHRLQVSICCSPVTCTLYLVLLQDLAETYLRYLLSKHQYSKAAALCPRLLGRSALLWERWVWAFSQLEQLPTIAHHIPTENPRLDATQSV